MPMHDDGDVIRGLGFVTLYAAYLEEAVDECTEALSQADSGADQRLRRRSASQKLKYCKQRLTELEPLSNELRNLPETIDNILRLFERRHEVVHGRIYAEYGQPDRLSSGRPDVETRPITSAELYDLANTLLQARQPLMHAFRFALPRLLKS